MPRWLLYTILFCVLTYLVTYAGQRLHLSVVSLFLVALALVWLFSGRAQLPRNSMRYLLYLILLPLAVVMGMNMLLSYLRQNDQAAVGNLILLGLLVLGAFLGLQLFRGKRR